MKRSRFILGLIVLAAAAGCSNGSEPTAYGPLDSKITQGEKQSYTAGAAQTPEIVVDLVYRNPLTGAAIQQPSRWERWVLPKVAYALQAVNVKVQPNSVVCVKQPYGELVPAVPCVNSDSLGNTRFDFLATTKAGKHTAYIQATYGIETTIPDTVEITVAPDVFASSPLQSGTSWPGRTMPATFPPEVAIDKYANAVGYMLVVLPDAYGQASIDTVGRTNLFSGFKVYTHTLSDTLGTTGARTVALDSLVGPTQINGYNVQRVCGTVQLKTAQGVSVTGTYVIAPRNEGPPYAFSLLGFNPAQLASRTNCPN